MTTAQALVQAPRGKNAGEAMNHDSGAAGATATKTRNTSWSAVRRSRYICAGAQDNGRGARVRPGPKAPPRRIASGAAAANSRAGEASEPRRSMPRYAVVLPLLATFVGSPPAHQHDVRRPVLVHVPAEEKARLSQRVALRSNGALRGKGTQITNAQGCSASIQARAERTANSTPTHQLEPSNALSINVCGDRTAMVPKRVAHADSVHNLYMTGALAGGGFAFYGMRHVLCVTCAVTADLVPLMRALARLLS
jgi:hypothetical protein